jgi:hypothetical protein
MVKTLCGQDRSYSGLADYKFTETFGKKNKLA